MEKACPDLVIHDNDGKPYAVRYDAVSVMLLHEFLKEHDTVSKLKATVAEKAKQFASQEKINEQQQQEISTFTESLKEQASLLQKVNAGIEINKPAPRVVSNNWDSQYSA